MGRLSARHYRDSPVGAQDLALGRWKDRSGFARLHAQTRRSRNAPRIGSRGRWVLRSHERLGQAHRQRDVLRFDRSRTRYDARHGKWDCDALSASKAKKQILGTAPFKLLRQEVESL